MTTTPRRTGFTLVEVMVAITLMAILATVSTVALSSLFAPETQAHSWETQLQEAQKAAVEGGRVVLVRPDSQPDAPVLLLPDGRALGEGVDPLSGRPEASR